MAEGPIVHYYAKRLQRVLRGQEVSVEFGVRTGPVTVLAVTQTRDGRLKMISSEGESLPGPTLKIGNTNSRVRFSLLPAAFVNAWCGQGPTHHCALGVGHVAGTLAKVGRLMDLEFVEVGEPAATGQAPPGAQENRSQQHPNAGGLCRP